MVNYDWTIADSMNVNQISMQIAGDEKRTLFWMLALIRAERQLLVSNCSKWHILVSVRAVRVRSIIVAFQKQKSTHLYVYIVHATMWKKVLLGQSKRESVAVWGGECKW